MTAYNTKEDKTWSCEKKMEEDGFRTLECLRGRLLAERQASRTSKENAEFLGNKLVELENKLKEETKMRKKTEKRLKVLMKKLESLNISSNFEASERSSSSENSVIFSSSSVSSSGCKDSDEYKSKSQSIHSEDSQDNVKDTVSENNVSDDTNHNYSSLIPNEESSSNQDVSDFSSDNANSSTQSSPDSKAEEQSSSSVKESVLEMETNAENESENEDYKVDDSMALVPVKVAAEPTKTTSELKIVNKSVSEVLDALRHAREKIQTSMENRRHMIRVGPV